MRLELYYIRIIQCCAVAFLSSGRVMYLPMTARLKIPCKYAARAVCLWIDEVRSIKRVLMFGING